MLADQPDHNWTVPGGANPCLREDGHDADQVRQENQAKAFPLSLCCLPEKCLAVNGHETRGWMSTQPGGQGACSVFAIDLNALHAVIRNPGRCRETIGADRQLSMGRRKGGYAGGGRKSGRTASPQRGAVLPGLRRTDSRWIASRCPLLLGGMPCTALAVGAAQSSPGPRDPRH